MTQDDIKAIVSKAIVTLYDEELPILEFDVGERTLCACLAAILKRSFKNLSVHVEYNREGIYPKAIELPDSDGEPTRQRVFPDIIIHTPGTNDDNLLVIEVKKSTNALGDEHDIAKLEKIKAQLDYPFAVFLRLPAGEGANAEAAAIEWV